MRELVSVMASEPGLTHLLALLRPSELALRDWVRPHTDRSMIDEIAAADHGVDAALHRKAIEDLLHAGQLPEQLSWHPEEVLALTRWSPVDQDRISPEAAHRLHVMRLLSCSILVGARTASGAPVNSLTPLVESAIELGPGAQQAAVSYLAWCRHEEPGDWRSDLSSRPILTLSLVLIASLLPVARTTDILPGLIGTFAAELSAAAAAEDLLWSPRPVQDLLRRHAQAASRRSWTALADRYLLNGPGQDTGHATQLTDLGRAIRGDLAADAAELRSLLQR